MYVAHIGQNSTETRASLVLSADEQVTVSAICNRVARMLGLLDREGLQRDIAIVQARYPMDLASILGAPDGVFVDELSSILDAADRDTGEAHAHFHSRFLLDHTSDTLIESLRNGNKGGSHGGSEGGKKAAPCVL